MGSAGEAPAAGVQFAEVDGSRSSQRAGKGVFSDAVQSVEPALAARIREASDWRKGYIAPIASVVEAGTRSPDAALQIANEGLASLRRRLLFVKDGTETSLDEALSRGQNHFETETITGEADRATRLEVPVRGDTLSGDPLKAQLDRWVNAGVMEPSAAAAIEGVIDDPAALDLSDQRIALLGAGSQMGPLEMLSRWGADVIAVDLPRSQIWQHIIETAKRGAGRLSFPARPGPQGLTERAGADLLAETPEVSAWLENSDGPVTVGNYVYADGATFVRLSGAVDAIVDKMLTSGAASGLAYLATPTDVFAVPEETVEGARESLKARRNSLSGALGKVSGKRLYAENYRSTVKDSDGRVWGIADCLVPVQGPNYALAKSLQRWRAIAAKDAGHTVSANVAPATRTASVTKNRVLAAAYNGAHRFGIEIFAPETSRALMAAMLVHDLRNGSSNNGATKHPYQLFASGAIHGGLWRSAYEPRSVLPLAVLGGLAKRN